MAFYFCGFADEAGKTLDEQIEVTKAAGWSAIELRLVDGTNVCNIDDNAWAVVRDKMAQAGMTIAGFGSAIANWARPITSDPAVDMEDLKRAIPRMKEVNCPLIRIMSYPNDTDNPLSDADWHKEVVKRLRPLTKLAEDNGIILGHENCNGYASIGPQQFMEVAAELDSPAFQLIFDTGNTTLHDSSREATWAFYQQCRDRIVHVHIKSYKPDAEGKWGTCYPDEDEMQAKILADLKRTDYDGWLSIEPHLAAAIHAGKDVDDATAAREIYLEYTRRLEAMVAAL